MTALGRARPVMKAAAERLLVAAGAPALLRLLRRPDALVLAYHNILPDGAPPAGDGGLHLPRAQFARQLDVVAETCEPVALTDVLRPAPRRARKPRVAITFDDAYWGAVTVGAAELARRRIPATIFVAPHFLGRTFWWDAIAWPGGSAWLDPFREHALRALAGRDDVVRRAAVERGLRVDEPPAYLRCATEDELRQAVASAPITLASHTWSHPNLAALPPAELREELDRPLDWLTTRFECVEPLLAYPYGSVSDQVVETTRAAGYAAAVTIGGGWIRGAVRDMHRIPRMNVDTELTLDGFVLSTAGLPRS
jgi:peptidoglycan/xylan/chitin deacetylase (PgdA/CDA1 family)